VSGSAFAWLWRLVLTLGGVALVFFLPCVPGGEDALVADDQPWAAVRRGRPP